MVKLTTDTGVVVKTYVYDAFGEEQDIIDSDTNHFRYCGEYYDKETKTLYLRARYYSSSNGRFTQEDPIRSGLNWYAYCWYNPVNLIDPLGLFSWGKLLTVLTIVAGRADGLFGQKGGGTQWWVPNLK